MASVLRVLRQRRGVLFVSLVLALSANAREKTGQSHFPTVIDSATPIVYNLMAAAPDTFGQFIANAEAYELQIIYTQIDRNAANEPAFRQYSWRLNPKAYFNPASLVKLPTALVSLERVRALKVHGLTRATRMAVLRGSGNSCITWNIGTPPDASLELCAKQMLVVSDNDAYSKVLDFLGQDYLNERLLALGFTGVSISRRFSLCPWEANRFANPVVFNDTAGSVIYRLSSRISHRDWVNPLGHVLKGVRYRNDDGVFVKGPYDFYRSNYLSLQTVNDLVKYVMFPGSRPVRNRFALTSDDLDFVRRCMAIYPRESGLTNYAQDTTYCDNYKKYFMFGDSYGYDKKIVDTTIRIFNMVGRMEGYLSDVAYIADFDEGVEFMLAAVIYTNRSNIMRNGNNEYYTEGLPFLAKLGRTVYAYEKTRKKPNCPDLTEFRKCSNGY